jgi:hypothetical protein
MFNLSSVCVGVISVGVISRKQLVGSGTYKNFSTAGVLVEEGNLSNWGAYQFYNLGLMIQPISLLKRK